MLVSVIVVPGSIPYPKKFPLLFCPTIKPVLLLPSCNIKRNGSGVLPKPLYVCSVAFPSPSIRIGLPAVRPP